MGIVLYSIEILLCIAIIELRGDFVGAFDKSKKKLAKYGSIPDIETMRAALIEREERRLREQYSDEDAWRTPRNFADSMMCVGYAMFVLNHYKEKVEKMSETTVINLYYEENTRDGSVCQGNR